MYTVLIFTFILFYTMRFETNLTSESVKQYGFKNTRQTTVCVKKKEKKKVTCTTE